MDDIGKALIMASHVLLFAIAASVSIYLYSMLMDAVDEFMLANNYPNRGDAIISNGDNSYRIVDSSEVIMAILNTEFTNNIVVVDNVNYSYQENDLKRNGVSIKTDEVTIRAFFNSNITGTYKLSYTNSIFESNPKLIYTSII